MLSQLWESSCAMLPAKIILLVNHLLLMFNQNLEIMSTIFHFFTKGQPLIIKNAFYFI